MRHKLEGMISRLQVTAAEGEGAGGWFLSLSNEQKKEYLKEHPNSKWGKYRPGPSEKKAEQPVEDSKPEEEDTEVQDLEEDEEKLEQPLKPPPAPSMKTPIKNADQQQKGPPQRPQPEPDSPALKPKPKKPEAKKSAPAKKEKHNDGNPFADAALGIGRWLMGMKPKKKVKRKNVTKKVERPTQGRGTK